MKLDNRLQFEIGSITQDLEKLRERVHQVWMRMPPKPTPELLKAQACMQEATECLWVVRNLRADFGPHPMRIYDHDSEDCD